MILVDFDMPKNCRECPIMGCIYHSVNDTRPDLCPIVREVKRGRWIRHDDLPYSECPFCHMRWSHITENFRYCFYCGADLREDA